MVTLGCRLGPGWAVTSIERTAYPRFKQLISAYELHLFFAPSREEAAWAAESTHSEGHQLALLPALKSYQRMGRFPKPEEYPAAVVDFVLRAVELPEGTVLPTLADKTAKNHRSLVRRHLDARYEPGRAGGCRGGDPGGGGIEEPPRRPDQHRAHPALRRVLHPRARRRARRVRPAPGRRLHPSARRRASNRGFLAGRVSPCPESAAVTSPLHLVGRDLHVSVGS
ncbi:DUF4158 domain-containing protein [Streptomyces piniterrae]|uniref:DUF4158 domain-containing protein n=1 Tax=Streptomyces piniterrae TaxID=2571125 RepID=UPI001FE63381|nr:DUF4158 domain-containing protein [Streptomyces piniterrae]